jgi:hypothetical protein
VRAAREIVEGLSVRLKHCASNSFNARHKSAHFKNLLQRPSMRAQVDAQAQECTVSFDIDSN